MPEDLAIGPPRLHVSTLRAYRIAIRLFCEYLLDRRYPWVAICTSRLGVMPRQIVDGRNLIVYVARFEQVSGQPAPGSLPRAGLVGCRRVGLDPIAELLPGRVRGAAMNRL